LSKFKIEFDYFDFQGIHENLDEKVLTFDTVT